MRKEQIVRILEENSRMIGIGNTSAVGAMDFEDVAEKIENFMYATLGEDTIDLKGKRISGRTLDGARFENAIVKLIYSDAIASGTRDYVTVTHIMSMDAAGVIYHCRPRDLYGIEDVPELSPIKNR